MSYRHIMPLLRARKQRGSRHVIQFTSHGEYRRFIAMAKQCRPDLFKEAWIQPLPLIRAVICSLEKMPGRHQGIRLIEKDRKLRVHAAIHKITSARPSIPWGVKQIHAPVAWKWSSGQNVAVGVIDTGIDPRHPDLRHCVSGFGLNLVQRGLFPYDDNGHGTHIAGTIAARSHDGGIAGIAPRALIVPVKAFDHQGAAYVADIIHGLEWLLHHGVRLINMSFGMDAGSQALKEAVVRARERGAILVTSAGNDADSKRLDYPAQYPCTLAVGATDRQRKLAGFSNRGSRVTIYAPGSKIYSTWLQGKYAILSGTSMATAHMSGVIALGLELMPRMTASDVERLLKGGSRPLRRFPAWREIDAWRFVRRVRLHALRR